MTLPEGIYHRKFSFELCRTLEGSLATNSYSSFVFLHLGFTCDEDRLIHAMRLFIGQPVWTPFPRKSNTGEEEHPSRKKYVKDFLTAPPAEEAKA